MTLEEAAARVGVMTAISLYVDAVDNGDIGGVCALFTSDGVLVPHGLPECRGHDAISAFLTASRASREHLSARGGMRHHVASVQIKLSSGGTARATSYFAALTQLGLDHWGVYRDELREAGSDWLFDSRIVTLEGAAPNGWVASGAAPVRFEAEAEGGAGTWPPR